MKKHSSNVIRVLNFGIVIPLLVLSNVTIVDSLCIAFDVRIAKV